MGEEALLGALRRRMEVLVLSLPSGSYAQRVRAEYLNELEARAQPPSRAGQLAGEAGPRVCSVGGSVGHGGALRESCAQCQRGWLECCASSPDALL